MNYKKLMKCLEVGDTIEVNNQYNTIEITDIRVMEIEDYKVYIIKGENDEVVIKINDENEITYLNNVYLYKTDEEIIKDISGIGTQYVSEHMIESIKIVIY